MSHICVDARLIDAGGIGTVIKQVVPKLAEKHRVTLLHAGGNLPPHEEKIECKAPLFSLQEQLLLRKTIPKCDLFWSPHINVPLLPVRARRRMVSIHDTYHLAHQLPKLRKGVAHLFYNAAKTLSDCIITDSLFSLTQIHSHCWMKKKRVHTIPLAGRFSRKEDEALLKRYLLPPSYLLFVGTLRQHKNLFTLLRAYLRLDTPPPLVVVGKKERFSMLDERALELIDKIPALRKKVRLLGSVPDHHLPTLYSHASLLIFPSLYEGFGLPPLEAMACGCPVVAANSASIPEVCGQAVHYVDPYSEDSIAQGIAHVQGSTSYRTSLIEKGYARAKLFCIERMTNRYLELVDEHCRCP